jgi:glycerol-3-phosphate dehydrogenase
MKAGIPEQADLAVVGGGINGAGIAALAARAGLSVVLFEKGDFASGTSSRSTKLIHGGIRYLEQMRFPLVFESLHERRFLLEEAPHLVRPLPFLLPSYREDARPAWMLRAGLSLYDALAGRHNLHRHRWLSPERTLSLAPALRSQGLRGCGLYHDAQVNDARLVLEDVLAAESHGAVCLNDTPVVGAETRRDGRVTLHYRHLPSGSAGTLHARCVANTTGPWTNETARMLSRGHRDLVRPTRGTHVVVPRVLPDHAVLVMSRSDRRIFFVIPWRDYSLVGTTDLDDPGDPDRVAPTEEEIAYLLEGAARVFPGASWGRERVLAAFAGLRPLAYSAGGHASSVSREDRILREGPVLTVLGGKLTTYRSMARKALRLAGSVLGVPFRSAPFPAFPGSPAVPWQAFLLTQVPLGCREAGLTPGQSAHLAGLYGARAPVLLELLKADPALKEPLHPGRPETLAQVAYAVLREKALHLSDVLLRRLEIGYTEGRTGASDEKASRLMAKLLGWDEGRRKAELADYRGQLQPGP